MPFISSLRSVIVFILLCPQASHWFTSLQIFLTCTMIIWQIFMLFITCIISFFSGCGSTIAYSIHIRSFHTFIIHNSVCVIWLDFWYQYHIDCFTYVPDYPCLDGLAYHLKNIHLLYHWIAILFRFHLTESKRIIF